MHRRLKTAQHLERMILMEMRRHAICHGVQAITVSGLPDHKSWEVTDIHAAGGNVPAACRDICLAAAAALREHYDILPEHDLAPDDDLRLGGV